MIGLLLDEHLSPEVARAVRAARSEVSIDCLSTWKNGQYIGIDDGLLLTAAREDGLSLVTYDQKTIRPLLVHWAQRQLSHAGVIFCDDQTIPASDIGGLARALVHLWDELGDLDWTDRVVYLTAS